MHGIVHPAVNLLLLLHAVFVSLPPSRGADVTTATATRGEAEASSLSSSPPGGFVDDGNRLSALDRAVADGRLSDARRLALALLAADPDREGEIARSFAGGCDEGFAADADGKDGGGGYLARVADALVGEGGDRRGRPSARIDGGECWDGVSGSGDAPGGAPEAWDRCCSRLPQTTEAERRRGIWERGGNHVAASSGGPDLDEVGCFDVGGTTPLCCEYFAGSRNHLRLPALRELSLRLRLVSDDNEDEHKETTSVIEIEQDGFLRRFEPSGILWPAGYLLALCVAAPVKCGMPELLLALTGRAGQHAMKPVAVELGAGVGAATIALARALAKLRGVGGRDDDSTSSTATGPLVVASDANPSALALVLANSHANGVGHLVAVSRTNHTDDVSLGALTRRFFPPSGGGGGFDVVIGSSLQSLFVGTEHPNSTLWRVLDALLSHTNPGAVALLAHTKSERILAPSLRPPPSDGDYHHDDHPEGNRQPTRFVCVRRVSGDDFGMLTRDGSSSDFEVSLFMREGSRATSPGPLMNDEASHRKEGHGNDNRHVAGDKSGGDAVNEL